VGTKPPISHFDTRSGWEAVKTPPIASKRKREVWGVGTKPPISRFDTRRCWGAVKHPHRVEMREGGVVVSPSRVLTRGRVENMVGGWW